jgi:hypothetical protein
MQLLTSVGQLLKVGCMQNTLVLQLNDCVTNECNIQTCITSSYDVQIGPNKVHWKAIGMNYAIMLINS